jgi:hypothetical protein
MNKKTLLLLGAAAVLIGAGYAWKEFNRTVATADDLPVKETVTAEELLGAFAADEAAATARFVGSSEQVVQVSGTIRSMEPVGNDLTNVVLETGDSLAGVVCEFANKDMDPNWRSGASVTIKGICTGVLMDVVLVRCSAVE